MKTVDKYRFSLQWGAESAEKIQAGEVLNKLGNKKSEFIVLAVTEYIKTHPEIPSNCQKINIVVKPSLTREQIEAMVKLFIKEELEGLRLSSEKNSHPNIYDTTEDSNLETMIMNLDAFTL